MTPHMTSLLAAATAAVDPARGAPTQDLIPATIVAVVALVGLTVIAWLLRYLDRGSFTPFVVYRVLLGVLVLALVQTGVLDPT